MGFHNKGYTAIRNDRKMGKGCGVAIFVRNGTRFSTVQLGRECESRMIKIWTGKYELAMTNYYNTCNKLSVDILNVVMGEVQGLSSAVQRF